MDDQSIMGLTEDEKALIHQKEKIKAIKSVRERTGSSLLEAKDLVFQYWNTLPIAAEEAERTAEARRAEVSTRINDLLNDFQVAVLAQQRRAEAFARIEARYCEARRLLEQAQDRVQSFRSHIIYQATQRPL